MGIPRSIVSGVLMLTPEEFVQQAGLRFNDLQLVRRALTHSSYVNENPEIQEDNERLEFLGDAALDFLIASWIYRHYPEMDEGHLTRLRSALVRTEQLAAFAEEINLGEAVLLGRGEESSGGRARQALLCDAFESLMGALFIDSGLEAVADFLEPRLPEAVSQAMEDESLIDARSLLQIWSQAELGETPRYRTIDATGPDHAREFLVEVVVGELPAAQGKGRSKQEAAQAAASEALKTFQKDEV
ncbi:MAG: ribonuclease III [Anaerolineales bacterium]